MKRPYRPLIDRIHPAWLLAIAAFVFGLVTSLLRSAVKMSILPPRDHLSARQYFVIGVAMALYSFFVVLLVMLVGHWTRPKRPKSHSLPIERPRPRT